MICHKSSLSLQAGTENLRYGGLFRGTKPNKPQTLILGELACTVNESVDGAKALLPGDARTRLPFPLGWRWKEPVAGNSFAEIHLQVDASAKQR
jgi:hypothetical protein